MQILLLGAILLTLLAAPVSAGMMTNGEPDQRAQCDLSMARIIVSGSEDTAFHPDDVKQCQDGDGEAGRDLTDDAFRPIPAIDPSGTERSRDLTNLPSSR